MDIFVARQPIFNREHQVFAYELLYRDSDKNYFTGNVASDVATSILLMNSYLNFGLNHLIGDHKAFLNFEKELVMNDIPQLLDKENVVIELLEDVVPDKTFYNKIKNLKSLGYTVAIDDFIESYEYNDLVEMCDIIKVEFMGATRKSIENIVRTWKPRGKILLAEKVETNEEFQWAKAIGFDLFQGYFFSKPAMIRSKAIDDHTANYMRLMEAMNVEEPDFKKIAGIIEMDVGFSYKLLKLVNSRFVHNNSIRTIQHALSMLGIKALRKWVSLSMLQSMSTPESHELILTSMIRSHLLESIAKCSKMKHHTQELTLMGILSILDAMLHKSMDDLLEELPVAVEIKDTLLGKETIYSEIYKLCLCYEQGDVDCVMKSCKLIDYDDNQLSDHYVEAVKWADETFKDVFS